MTIFRSLKQFFSIIARRLREQGWRTTFAWFRTVGLAWVTGRLSLQFSHVTPNILLGPQFGRYGKQKLENMGVTASVSMRAEYDDAAFGLDMPQYHYIPTEDNTAPTIEDLQSGVAFIKEIIEDEGIVYVHCGSGVGRAPTMVAAYLISEGNSVDNAIAQITEARPFIRILPPQVERLKEFQEMVNAPESLSATPESA